MVIRSLNHAALLVADVERSRRFYAETLQMQEIARPATFDFPGAWLRRGSAELHLIGEAEPGRAAQVVPGYRPDELARGYAAHLAFEVEDLEAVVQELHGLGVELAGGPRPRGDGVQQLFLRDPDGYLIELFAFPAP